MKVGLTLGKFAPFHRGHQSVVETALAEVDQLLVLIYDAPETTTVPLEVRSRWIRELYPTAEVIECRGGPKEVGDSPEIKRAHESYILQVLDGRPITHFYSSEFYGDHVSQALQAIDRRVDPPRRAVPISGSALREDLFFHRQFVHPLVYQDLITRVVLLGAPSTGKTTLAKSLAELYATTWMPEYGREYWEQHQRCRRLTLEQLIEIAEGHLEREERHLLQSNEILFVDTNAMTTREFAIDYHGTSHPRLDDLADAAESRYDLFFLCEDDIPYDDSWDRSGEVHRARFQRAIRADLERRSVPFTSLRGRLEERMSQVRERLRGFDRFSSGDRG